MSNQDITTLLTLKKLSDEIAGMYCIAKEQQDIVNKLIESNKNSNQSTMSFISHFNSTAKTLIENTIKKELNNVGKLVTQSTLDICNKSVQDAISKISIATKYLGQSEQIFKDASAKLALKVWLLITSALILTILGIGVIGKVWVSYTTNEIQINQQLLADQEKALSILSAYGVKVISNHEGVFVIIPKGLGSAECGGKPCYFLK